MSVGRSSRSRFCETVRLLTYNVRMNTKCAQAYGLSGTDARLAQIGEWVIGRDGGTKRPDVLALQEAYCKEVSTGPEGNGERLERAFPGYRIAQKQDQRWILYSTATLTRTDGVAVGVGEPQPDTKVFPWAQFARKRTNHRITVVNVHLTHSEPGLRAAHRPPHRRRPGGPPDEHAPPDGVHHRLQPGPGTVGGTRPGLPEPPHRSPLPRHGPALRRRCRRGLQGPRRARAGHQPGRGGRQVGEVHRRRSDHNAVYAELSWSADRC